MTSNKRIFIAGGTGLLGGYLLDALNKDNLPVTILSHRDKLPQDTENCNYLKTDYSLEHLSNLLSTANALVVLAAQRATSSEFDNYFPSIALCDNLYEAAYKNNVRNIVFASSISVYSDLTQLPWTEASSLDPVSKYGISKVTCELLGNWYSNKKNLYVKNLRFAHLYGANEKNNYMINLFMRRAYHHLEISLLTSSVAHREFLYAKDAALAIIAALQKDRLNGSFNIGSSDVLTNLQVAQTINKAFNNPVDVVIKDPNAQETIESSYMSSDLANKILDYTPRYTLETALQEIYLEMEKENDIPILY